MVETIHTVLIVEGDDDTRRMLRSLLLEEGWRTLEAATAAQARGHLRRPDGKVNAVLLDLGRPGSREALDLRESLMKDSPRSRQLPVILTGTSSHEAMAPPLSGLPLIIKPYVFEDLLRTLKREVHNVQAGRNEAGGSRTGDGP